MEREQLSKEQIRKLATNFAAPPGRPMTAAEIASQQADHNRLAAEIELRMWAIQCAMEQAKNGSDISTTAEAIFQFIAYPLTSRT